MLNMSTDKVCYIVVKAREFDVKEAPEGMYDGSDAADDGFAAVLEDTPDDPVLEELTSFLGDLNVDEMEQLLALTWLGRGDYTVDDWQDALAQAREVRDETAPQYLLGIPLLADYPEDGLSRFGLTCQDFEMGHL